MAQTDAEKPAEKKPTSTASGRYKEVIQDFSNLPEEQRMAFLKMRNEAGQLFQNKRIIEAFEVIRKMQLVFEDDPQILNLLGACYVEMRDFDKARIQFDKAKNITGPNFNVLFNIAEIAFVTGEWQTCLTQLDACSKLIPANAMQMKHLVEFKTMLCHIRLAEAESTSEADRKMHDEQITAFADKHHYLDDTPYYYYAQAALNFYKKDDTEAQRKLNAGRRVFASTPVILASWEDTMTEIGYVKSYYGNDSKKEESTNP